MLGSVEGRLKFLQWVFSCYQKKLPTFHCAIRTIMSLIPTGPEMIIKKFEGILKVWLEINIAFSLSKFVCGRLDYGLETAPGTKKSFLAVQNLTLFG